MGYKGQLALYIYYLLSAGALRQLSPPLALMTAQESSLSGGFRAAHQVRSPCLQRSATSSMYMLWSQMSYGATHHTSRHDKAVTWAMLLPGTWIISLHQIIARTQCWMSFSRNNVLRLLSHTYRTDASGQNCGVCAQPRRHLMPFDVLCSKSGPA